MEPYVRAMPKVELHVHLEGAIRPATLLALADRNGVALPATDLDGLRRWFVYRDFNHFVEIYVLTDELLLLHTAFGLDADALDEIVLAVARHSFLPPARRQRLEAHMRSEMRALKASAG